MVIIGLDYGQQRIGMAASDELEIAAHPLPTVRKDGTELDAVARAVAERGAGRIVVGLPIQMDGAEGIQARKVRAFVKELKRRLRGVEVVTMDERLTTAQAQRALSQMGATARRRKENVDRMAAQIILQRHLDQRAAERREADQG
jgi:putative Holliday junction resolvase